VPVARNHLGFSRAGERALLAGLSNYVYAIYDGAYIKVGRSGAHPMERLHALQTGNPRRLTLLGWHLGVLESRMHKRLWRWHVSGEWFEAGPAVLAEISTWHWLNETLLREIRRGVAQGVG
jgi:hypothetical protein